MLPLPPRSTLTDTLFPYTTLCRTTIVLAIGTQGNPNRLRCPGNDLPHIIYQVDDPEDFKDRHITVVGSGDAGIENALGVAEEALENRVTILNRSRDFARAKAKNVSDLMDAGERSEEHTSELQSLMRISYAVFCLK